MFPYLHRSRVAPQVTVLQGGGAVYGDNPYNLNLSRITPLKIGWLGVLGDMSTRLATAGFRSLFQALPEVESIVHIVGCDVLPGSPDGALDRIVGNPSMNTLCRNGFPIRAYFDSHLFFQQLATQKLDAVYIALPPQLHASVARQCLTTTTDSVLMIEKPLALPSDLKAMQTLVKEHGARILDGEFLNTTLPMFYLLFRREGRELMSKLDSPIHIRAAGMHRERLSPKYGDPNGGRQPHLGGGNLLEGGTHHMAAVYTFLHYYSKAHGNEFHPPRLRPSSTFLASYDAVPGLRESYAYAEFEWQDACIQMQAGCGVSTDAHFLEVTSESGQRVILSTGTVDRPPYLFFDLQSGPPQYVVFDDVGYGYELLFYRLLAYADQRGKNAHIFPASDVGLSSALWAAQMASEIGQLHTGEVTEFYELGTMPRSHFPVADTLVFDRYVPLRPFSLRNIS